MGSAHDEAHLGGRPWRWLLGHHWCGRRHGRRRHKRGLHAARSAAAAAKAAVDRIISSSVVSVHSRKLLHTSKTDSPKTVGHALALSQDRLRSSRKTHSHQSLDTLRNQLRKGFHGRDAHSKDSLLASKAPAGAVALISSMLAAGGPSKAVNMLDDMGGAPNALSLPKLAQPAGAVAPPGTNGALAGSSASALRGTPARRSMRARPPSNMPSYLKIAKFLEIESCTYPHVIYNCTAAWRAHSVCCKAV